MLFAGSRKLDWNSRPSLRRRRWFLSLGSLSVAAVLACVAVNIDHFRSDYIPPRTTAPGAAGAIRRHAIQTSSLAGPKRQAQARIRRG
jgi:hypothetical protein